MTKADERQQDHTLEAIAAVAHEGEKHFLYISLGIVVAILIVIGFFLIRHLNRPPALADVPIAIMLPRLDEGSARNNAARQWEGFFKAYIDNKVFDGEDQHRYHFNYLPNTGSTGEKDECEPDSIKALAKKSEFKAMWQKAKCRRSRDEIQGCDENSIKDLAAKNDAEAMLRQVKCWYYKDGEGVRVFIITMSGAVKIFRQKFIDWADTLDPDDRPILLATVVSAPDVADVDKSVFRHYIRSRDESDTLATYIESLNPNPSRIGIIHVDDEYGVSAKDLLKARLERNATVDAYIVPFGQPEPGVRDDFGEFVTDNNDLAVVIGYGSMIEITLDRLKALSGFHGPILLVSTFTEEGWRPEQKPEDVCFWDRIHYVGPITDAEETDSERRGVVFQFSYLTLDRALKCRDERGVDNFWACFTNDQILEGAGKKWNPHVEFTRHGDAHVSLGIFKLIDDQSTASACQAGEQPG